MSVRLAILACILISVPLLNAQQTPRSTSAAQPASSATQQPAVTQTVTGYTLPPDLYQKAHDRRRIHFRLDLLGFVYGVVVLWLILRWKFSANYRNLAERASTKRFVQNLAFSPLILLTIAVLTLPLDVYSEWVEKGYGISIQSWGSWGLDWLKAEMISLILGTVLIAFLYFVIRRSARRWWFYFWLITLPIGLCLVFLQPLVIDPMFHKFEPLQQRDPALTASLEQLVQRAGQDIPPERMFWMGAGEKTTSLNAYVTGIGSSKRIVVWDTTIAKMTTPQIVFVASHEMGHYVLQHLPKGLTLAALLFLALFYLGYRCVGWVLARWGGAWEIRGLDDWASLPVLILLFTVFSFITNPLAAAGSRYFEHQADQYGLEVTHGLTSDSGQIAAQAFQTLGVVGLSDPNPSPVDVLMFYDHPPITDRVQFSLSYNPWAGGGQGEFVK